MPPPEANVYEAPSLIVEPLNAGKLNDELIIAMQGLLRKAYADTFEDRLNILESGSVSRHLFAPPDGERVEKYRKHVLNDISKGGSEYWLGRCSRGGPLVSLAKLTPSRGTVQQKFHLQPPNLFINDVVVCPDQQGRTIGGQTLFAAIMLSRHSYSPVQKVALHAFDANTPLEPLLYRLGLWPMQKVKALQVGDQQLEQRLWTSGSFGIRHLVKQLRPEVYDSYVRSSDIKQT